MRILTIATEILFGHINFDRWFGLETAFLHPVPDEVDTIKVRVLNILKPDSRSDVTIAITVCDWLSDIL